VQSVAIAALTSKRDAIWSHMARSDQGPLIRDTLLPDLARENRNSRAPRSLSRCFMYFGRRRLCSVHRDALWDSVGYVTVGLRRTDAQIVSNQRGISAN